MIHDHPHDIPGHLTRQERWARISIALLLGVSLAVARTNMERSSLGDLGASKWGKIVDLMNLARSQGWKVERTNKATHWRFVPPDKKKPIVIVAIGEGPRSQENAIAQLRRSGLVIPR